MPAHLDGGQENVSDLQGGEDHARGEVKVGRELEELRVAHRLLQGENNSSSMQQQ